ncbi:MAG: FHA domain-containing protein [Chloroflexi bacterium]|nr:FHA domain-containing protein [Chloroflexota bacterium]
MFCSECGRFLLEDDRKATDVLPFSDYYSHRPPPPPTEDFQLETGADHKKITFVIPHSRNRHVMELVGQIRIGRGSTDTDDTPELDLAEENGAELGVSRLHATIQWSNHGLVLIDLESTNGTLLNNHRLPAKRPYPLRSGDEIRFGDLLIHIFFDA